MEKSVLSDLVDYLTGQTTAPDAVITVPFNVNQLLIGNIVEDNRLAPAANGLQVAFKLRISSANAKWMRDDYSIEIISAGNNAGKYLEAEDLLLRIFHTLLGIPSFIVNDKAFVHFNSNSVPRFVGYLDDTRPVFATNMSFVVEGLTDKFNRTAIR